MTSNSCFSGDIMCVRWNPSGDILANAGDQTAKLLDLKAGKMLYSESTSDESKL